MRLKRWLIIAAVILAAVIAGGVYAVAHPFLLTFLAATTRNYFVSLGAPPGTITIEANPSYQGPPAVAPSPAATPPGGAAADWPMYNRTLTSDRYSPLSQIDAKNVSELKVLCTYDTDEWVCPGYIATEMVMAVPKDVLEKSILPQIAVHRLGQPEEVARCVVFLASDDAGYITGSTLSANGGQAMI